MITVFDNIPNEFIDHYDAQLERWAREFRTRGKRCAIVFDVLPGQKPKRDEEGRLVWVGAWLKAEVETSRGTTRVAISPDTDWDKEMIERHSWDLRRRACH